MESVTYRSEVVEVDFCVEGEYRSQTHWQPAEYPDYIIEDVFYNGTSIFNILNEDDLEEIHDKLIAKLEYC